MNTPRNIAPSTSATVPRLLTVEDVAEALRCSRRKVYDLVARGELPIAYKLFHGSRKGWRWTSADLVSYLNECQAMAHEQMHRDIESAQRQYRQRVDDPPPFDPERLKRKSA